MVNTSIPTYLRGLLLFELNVSRLYSGLALLEQQSRCGKPLKFQVVCPQNGTAAIKGSATFLARGHDSFYLSFSFFRFIFCFSVFFACFFCLFLSSSLFQRMCIGACRIQYVDMALRCLPSLLHLSDSLSPRSPFQD